MSDYIYRLPTSDQAAEYLANAGYEKGEEDD